HMHLRTEPIPHDFFFFQAEDGIRAGHVTGVQTCALPIYAMINVSIAATFTPFGLLVLSGTLATVSLAFVWGGALGGILLHVLWIDAPKSLSAVVYVVLGCSGIAALPQLVSQVGWGPTGLLALGGALYSAGAAVYAF